MPEVTLAGVFTVDDLDWARGHFGATVELDPWGNLIVTPATDAHERAVAVLHRVLGAALGATGSEVFSHGPPWRVAGGSGYTNVPDLCVLRAGTRRVGEAHQARLQPPPLLVAEIAAPSTRVVDRDPARKLGDCLAGGASWYLLVDLPGLAPVDVPRFEVPRATPGGWQSSGPSDRPTTLALGADGGGEVVVDPVVLGWPGSLA